MIRRSWTRPASIEETLALWAASLREIKKRIRPLFNQDRVARNAGLFLESLLGDEQRKTGWMRAEAAGDPGPWRQQAILGRRDWDADGLRDIVRDYVIEHLAADDAGAGTKGPRLHDWCYLELADLEIEEFYSANHGLWTRGLLIRRHIADGDLAFFTTWCPAGTSIETLVAVEGHRWAIEDSFETAKNEFGLNHNESRSWHGWHRHVSLVMLAFRHDGGDPPSRQFAAAKKRNAEPRQNSKYRQSVIDPLVNPGSPPHRHQARPKADPTRPYHRMVTLAQSSPGRRSTCPLQKTTTVMLDGRRISSAPRRKT